MASITKNEHKSYGMGLHDEVLTGRTQQTFFNPSNVSKQPRLWCETTLKKKPR